MSIMVVTENLKEADRKYAVSSSGLDKPEALFGPSFMTRTLFYVHDIYRWPLLPPPGLGLGENR